MTEVEEILRRELRPETTSGARPDWDEIATRAGLDRVRTTRRRSVLICAAAATMVLLLGLATPLGAALARELDGFSAWVSGQPGKPVDAAQQRAFDAANASSWAGFPTGTKLRKLVVRHVPGATVELVGFRSGTSRLCLRLTVSGTTRGSRLGCAPLSELREAGAPVRVVMIDQPVGRGEKTAWYGIDRVRSSRLQITAGISADNVKAVVLTDDQGRHRVPAVSNSFLYIAERPDVGQRVRTISAVTTTGAVAVPFAPSPFGFGGAAAASAGPPAPAVERTVTAGRIGWLERQQPRGEPLDVLPARTRAELLGARLGRIVFGRVLTPDPDSPARMVLTLNSHRRGGKPAGLCTMLVQAGGGGGGCAVYPGTFTSTPISVSTSGNGSDEFVTLSGFASDDVARIDALQASGTKLPVPLADNAFIVEVARSRLPVRLVAYDTQGRVIGSTEPLGGFGGGASPARARATSLLRANGPNGATYELLISPSSDGGECMYLRHHLDARHAGVGVRCTPRTPHDRPLELERGGAPTMFLGGRVRPDVTTVRIEFADGTHHDIHPTRGYVLYATSADRLAPARAPTRAQARTADGQVLETLQLN